MSRGFYLYQIEVSNHCSLKCGYCPHPIQGRPKGFMSYETFRKCVELFKIAKNENRTLFLHNFGEAMLHPELDTFIRYARDHGLACSFFTNGVDEEGNLFPKSRWQAVADAGLEQVSFSAHRVSPSRFKQHVAGIVDVEMVYTPLRRHRHDWAGQVDESRLSKAEAADGGVLTTLRRKGRDLSNWRRRHQPCLFERRNALVIQWTGRVSTCCIDIEGQREDITVDDVLRDGYAFRAIALCEGCSLMREDEWL